MLIILMHLWCTVHYMVNASCTTSKSSFGPAISRGKRTLLIETTILQSFGPVILVKSCFWNTQISRLETGAYLLLFPLHAICSQNHVYAPQFFLYKKPKLSSTFNQNISQNLICSLSTIFFSQHCLLCSASSALSCTSVLRRVCLSQVTILHHYLLLNLFYRIGLLMRDLVSFFLRRCLLCFVVVFCSVVYSVL